MLVICLILGVLFREVGFLDEASLTKANGFTFVIGAVLVNVFASLASTTPAILLSMIKPLLIAVVIGLVSCTAVAILVGRIFKQSWYMSFALGVTALFGFPGTLIVPTEVAKAVAEKRRGKGADPAEYPAADDHCGNGLRVHRFGDLRRYHGGVGVIYLCFTSIFSYKRAAGRMRPAAFMSGKKLL